MEITLFYNQTYKFSSPSEQSMIIRYGDKSNESKIVKIVLAVLEL